MPKEYKKPDLFAPRFKRTRFRTTSTDSLKIIKNNNPALKKLTDAKLRSLIKKFNTTLWQMAIEYRDGVDIPEQLGHIFIGTCPPPKKRNNIDFEKSAAHQVELHHMNWGSDNYFGKIFYTTHSTKYPFLNNELWGFEGCRLFTRSVAAVYQDNWKKYVEVDPFKKIAYLYKGYINKEYSKKKEEEFTQTYNELDLS